MLLIFKAVVVKVAYNIMEGREGEMEREERN